MQFRDILFAAASDRPGAAAAPASSRQFMLPRGNTVSSTGTKQFLILGTVVSEG